MSFRISALRADQFQDLSELDTNALSARNIHKQIVDVHPGFPCRISLEDIPIGETVYLLNFTHHDHPTPYQSSHAIFIRDGAVQAHPAADEIPYSISSRLLSVRAFNQSHDMVDADVIEGQDLTKLINRFFENEAVEYLHIHNARPGCYAARVDRV